MSSFSWKNQINNNKHVFYQCYIHRILLHLMNTESGIYTPATVDQSDARRSGDQKIPAGSSNILTWIVIMKCFLRSFSPFR